MVFVRPTNRIDDGTDALSGLLPVGSRSSAEDPGGAGVMKKGRLLPEQVTVFHIAKFV